MALMQKQLLLFLLMTAPLAAADSPSEGGGYESVVSAQELYSQALRSIQNEEWAEAELQMREVLLQSPDSPFAREARYYLGVALFRLGNLEGAAEEFADYLKRDRNPAHFESVFEYKLRIAERYAQGERRRLFHASYMPRWGSGREDAMVLYDEIIVTLPSHPLAAEALFGKGRLLAEMKEELEAIENYQILIARFPKHSKLSEGYLAIAQLYLELSRNQKHDPDLLALAQINLRKFRHDFPADGRIKLAEESLLAMREVYAEGLYETGRFYERKKKPSSALVYYRAVMRDYPDTHTAQLAQGRMDQLGR